MKIAIIGYSGSGKSTLAKLLGEKYGVKILYLDRVQWLPGWQERDSEEKKAIAAGFLDSNTSWVIDGNYSKLSYERRMREADRIIFLNFNRFSCLFRAFKRFIKYRGVTRESMGQGCPEKMDFEFVMWILRDGRNAKIKARYDSVLKEYGDKTVVIKNQRQLNAFMAAEGL